MKQLSRQCLQGAGDEPKHTGSVVLMRTSMSPEDGSAFYFCGVVDMWWGRAEYSDLRGSQPLLMGEGTGQALLGWSRARWMTGR